MRVLLSYPTDVGIFDIGQCTKRKYHPMYNEESLGSFSSMQEAVDALVNNELELKDYESGQLIDTSKLGISSDYTQWDSNY